MKKSKSCGPKEDMASAPYKARMNQLSSRAMKPMKGKKKGN